MDKRLIKKMNKLIIIGKEKNKVLPVSEAFNAYPVNKEKYKGKLENITYRSESL